MKKNPSNFPLQRYRVTFGTGKSKTLILGLGHSWEDGVKSAQESAKASGLPPSLYSTPVKVDHVPYKKGRKIETVNPPSKRPATPAQIAARKRFTEIARSGGFKKHKAAKRHAKVGLDEYNRELAKSGIPRTNPAGKVGSGGRAKLEKTLAKQAKKLRLPAERAKAYVFGTLRRIDRQHQIKKNPAKQNSKFGPAYHLIHVQGKNGKLVRALATADYLKAHAARLVER